MCCALALMLAAGSASAAAHGPPGGHGLDGPPDHGGGPPPDHGGGLPPDHGGGLPPDHGGGPPPWAHGQGQEQSAPAPPTPPAIPAPASNPTPVSNPTPPAPSPGAGGSQGDSGHDHGAHGHRGDGNGHDHGHGNDGTPPGQANHGTNTSAAPTVTSPVPASTGSAPTATVTPIQAPVAVTPVITTPTLTTTPATIPTVTPTSTPTSIPTLLPGITISSLPFPETTTTRVGNGLGAQNGAGRSTLATSPLALPSAAAVALLDPSAAQAAAGHAAAGHATSAGGGAAAAGSHNVPAVLHATSAPAATIEHFISVIPLAVWIALAVAISLAAMGGGAAVTFGRRASRKSSEVAAVTAAAVTDQLTGILNRRGFTQSAERELDRARRYGHPLALAYVDVRGLKAVNDSEGHLAGDRLLREVATMLSQTARAHDVVGRMGGDELAVLLAEQQGPGAVAMSERIRENVPEHREALGFRTSWDVTIGTASFPDDGDTLDDLIAAADRRMYEQRGIELRQR